MKNQVQKIESKWHQMMEASVTIEVTSTIYDKLAAKTKKIIRESDMPTKTNIMAITDGAKTVKICIIKINPFK